MLYEYEYISYDILYKYINKFVYEYSCIYMK